MVSAVQRKEEKRVEWFWMLMSYVKFKNLELWARCYPNSSYESFDAIWPVLLDQMMENATRATLHKLKEQIERSGS